VTGGLEAFSRGRYSLDLMTAPFWCSACNALTINGFSLCRNCTSTPVSFGQMDLKSELVAAIATGWPTRQDGMGPRLRADVVPTRCPLLFPGDVPEQPLVDLKRFWERILENMARPCAVSRTLPFHR